MTWFLVDDGFHAHPKVVDCSLPALGLWVRGGSWCAKYLTDGAISLAAVRQLGGNARHAAELVRVRLWSVAADGWQYHDWLEIQHARDVVLAKRAADAARKHARNPSGFHAESAAPSVRNPSGVLRAVAPDSGRLPRAPIPDPLPKPLQRDLEPSEPPPLSSSDTANIEEFGGSGAERSRTGEHVAQCWLEKILFETVTQSAPRSGGKWRIAYRYIGAQPETERDAAELVLRAELTARRLHPRMCTPGHVADYWHDYAGGRAPGGAIAARSSGPVSTLEEYEADARREQREAEERRQEVGR